ncbi:MAG: hypothetical protein ACLPVO_13850, partial [Desulfomonilaceae bacterium]
MRIKVFVFVAAASWLAIYTYFCLSPSSYGVALQRLNAQADGVILGGPRSIRTDEWAVGTPLIQIAVLNNFKRFNSISIYGEDLRGLIGLPLKDWAMIFKPYFWPFCFLEPASALAFYHGFWILFFVSGYSLLFRRLRFEPYAGIAATLLIYYSGFSQVWWTVLGPPAAGFPWVMLTAMSQLYWPVKLLLMIYISVGWLTSELYAPVFIAFVFLGLVLLIVFDPKFLRPSRLLVPLLGVAVASLIVYIYLYDVFTIMEKTIYPGQRRTSGGSVFFIQWLSQFFPYSVISTPSYAFMTKLGNVCESGTLGSYLPLMTIVFLDYGRLAENFRNDQTKRKVILQVCLLLFAFLMISAWQLLPIPSEFGAITLWNRFGGSRLFFISGFLLLVASLLTMKSFSLKLDRNRVMVFSILAGLAWIIPGTLWSNEFSLPRNLTETWNDLTVILGVWFLYFYNNSREREHCLPTGLILVALIPNIIAWAPFNPIQSTRSIFSIQHEKTPVTMAFDRLAKLHPKGWITTPFYNGALLGGLGYKSLAHILPCPQLSWFRPYFPEMTDDQFDQVFNRYTHLIPATGEDFTPYVPHGDVVTVPSKRFGTPEIPIESVTKVPDGFDNMAGQVERIEVDKSGSKIKIIGWAKMALPPSGPVSRLFVHTGLPLKTVIAFPVFRPDICRELKDNRLWLSGFTIVIRLARPIKGASDLTDLEIFC